jgi:hypothetical protein
MKKHYSILQKRSHIGVELGTQNKRTQSDSMLIYRSRGHVELNTELYLLGCTLHQF